MCESLVARQQTAAMTRQHLAVAASVDAGTRRGNVIDRPRRISRCIRRGQRCDRRFPCQRFPMSFNLIWRSLVKAPARARKRDEVLNLAPSSIRARFVHIFGRVSVRFARCHLWRDVLSHFFVPFLSSLSRVGCRFRSHQAAITISFFSSSYRYDALLAMKITTIV